MGQQGQNSTQGLSWGAGGPDPNLAGIAEANRATAGDCQRPFDQTPATASGHAMLSAANGWLPLPHVISTAAQSGLHRGPVPPGHFSAAKHVPPPPPRFPLTGSLSMARFSHSCAHKIRCTPNWQDCAEHQGQPRNPHSKGVRDHVCATKGWGYQGCGRCGQSSGNPMHHPRCRGEGGGGGGVNPVRDLNPVRRFRMGVRRAARGYFPTATDLTKEVREGGCGRAVLNPPPPTPPPPPKKTAGLVPSDLSRAPAGE